jgi:hypothetical protein
LLEVWIDDDFKAVKIYCDSAGIAKLERALSILKGHGAWHLHLTENPSGGLELSKPIMGGQISVPELIIDYVE